MAAYASARPRAADVPRPLRSALPFLLLCLAGLALAAAPDVPWAAGAATGGLFLLAAAVRGGRAEHELRLLRQQADRALLRGIAPAHRSALVAWRADELTGDAHRLSVAAGVDRLLRDLDPAKLPGASPLNRVVARGQIDLIHRLRARLADLGAPVEARGVLMTEWLLRDATSPLYDRGRADSLPQALARTIAALEPRA
ncbi:MAG TPA: hypothetical protein VF101_03280 [Gaiellaceae bacterium]